MITANYEEIFKGYSDVVGVKEVGEMLGMCSKKVRRLIKEGAIPVITCGKPFRIAKIHLIEYIFNTDREGDINA